MSVRDTEVLLPKSVERSTEDSGVVDVPQGASRFALPRLGRFGLGLLLMLLVVFIWVGSSALIQYVFTNNDFQRPFFVTYTSTSLFTLYLFGFLCLPWRWNGSHLGARSKQRLVVTVRETTTTSDGDDNDARGDNDNRCDDRLLVAAERDDERAGLRVRTSSRESPPLRASNGDNNNDNNDDDDDENVSMAAVATAAVAVAQPMSTKDVARFALFFAPIWFVANVTFNWSLALTSVSSTTIISSTSGLFTLLLGVVLRLTTFHWVKLLGVALTIGGVVAVTLSDKRGGGGGDDDDDGAHSLAGDLVCLVSAMAYAVYANVLQKNIEHETRVSMAMFFGFVGLWNLLGLWPLFFVLHWSGLESFTWPSATVAGFLLLNGLIGTVLSDLIWLQSMLLTSPLVATLGLSLTIPAAMLFDFFGGASFSFVYLLGSMLVLVGFVVVTVTENKR